jgi:hypothetical protein
LDASRGIIGRKFRFPTNVEPFMDITKALWIGILLQKIGITLEVGTFVDSKLSSYAFDNLNR